MRASKCLAEDLIEPEGPWTVGPVGETGRGWAPGLFAWPARVLSDRRVIMAVRLALGLIFLVSALGKLIDINQYSVHAVYEFDILPGSLARIYGLALPFIELSCALGLLTGVLMRLSALGIGLLAVSFFAAKGIILLRGQDIVCGCFGPITSTLASVSIYADPPILLMSLVVALSSDVRRE